jgi:dipeptidyl-peptidase-4
VTVVDSFPRQHARTRRFTLGAPRDIRVGPDGTRVLFLRSLAGDDPVNRLWLLDVSTGDASIVADPASLLRRSADVPDAERARRERARELAGGIVAYDTTPDLDVVTFALSGRVFILHLSDGDISEVPSSGDAFDPRIDPTGRYVSYVSGTSLRVTASNRARRRGRDGDRLLAGEDDSCVSWGSAEFVAAEEMHRTRGHWWSPDGTRIVAERVDVSGVAEWFISSPIEPSAMPRPIRYPAAGTANAAVSLGILGLDGSRVDVDWQRGEFEYLCDVSWPADQRLTLVVQTRDQRTLAVLTVDEATGATSEVTRQHDEHWVELVPGAPAWIGHRLLTVVDRDGARRVCVDGDPITPADLQVRRVVDTGDDDVLVAATDEPAEVHVYRVGLDGSVERLTEAPGVHNATRGGDVMVLSSAGTDFDGTRTEVRRAGAVVATIASHAETPLVRPHVSFAVIGQRALRTALLLPERGAADPPGPLPVLLDPYGGPHALRVQRTRGAFLTSQWFADQGFAVIVCDGRGTPARGPEWERAIRGDFATSVLDDQVEALQGLAARDERLDLSRVAIRGWSFGGYLAALAVLRRPDVFHAAVAGAPVTEWRLYDTHYTERYLGHPDAEPENYRRSDLTPLAATLERPLLLIHGMADDNVVVAHTLRLSRALLEHGRAHRVVPLSGVTHMTPQETVAENLLRLEVDFFRDTLGF